MRVLATRAALLLGILAAACEPPAQFVDVSGHPGKRGIDGGTDGGPPPPGPIPTLIVTVEGPGRVFSPFFDCPGTCSASVMAGTAIEVRAEGAEVRWTGACAGATECRIVVEGDTRVGAIFVPQR